MDATTTAWLDQEDARTSRTIRRCGWAIEYVGDECSAPGRHEDPSQVPFAYTIGLFGMGHPELLVLGLGPEPTATLLNALGRRVRDGEDLLAGVALTVTGWPSQVVVEAVPNPGQILFGANRHYQRPDEASVPALQLAWADSRGRFPWQPGCEVAPRQPRPGGFRA